MLKNMLNNFSSFVSFLFLAVKLVRSFSTPSLHLYWHPTYGSCLLIYFSVHFYECKRIILIWREKNSNFLFRWRTEKKMARRRKKQMWMQTNHKAPQVKIVPKPRMFAFFKKFHVFSLLLSALYLCIFHPHTGV